jgi:hypothetical protein
MHVYHENGKLGTYPILVETREFFGELRDVIGARLSVDPTDGLSVEQDYDPGSVLHDISEAATYENWPEFFRALAEEFEAMFARAGCLRVEIEDTTDHLRREPLAKIAERCTTVLRARDKATGKPLEKAAAG